MGLFSVRGSFSDERPVKRGYIVAGVFRNPNQ